MKLKIFTFGFSPSEGCFDDTSLQEFLIDKELIEYTEHFFIHENIPHLAIIVSYREAIPQRKRGYSGGQKVTSQLDAGEKKIYNALSNWRAARAKHDGVAPYLIVTNAQLATIIKNKPQSKKDLIKVRGIGEVKAEQYGDDILKILAQGLTDAPATERADSKKEGEK